DIWTMRADPCRPIIASEFAVTADVATIRADGRRRVVPLPPGATRSPLRGGRRPGPAGRSSHHPNRHAWFDGARRWVAGGEWLRPADRSAPDGQSAVHAAPHARPSHDFVR